MHGTGHARIKEGGRISAMNGSEWVVVFRFRKASKHAVPARYSLEAKVQDLLDGRRRHRTLHDRGEQFETRDGLGGSARHDAILSCTVRTIHSSSSGRFFL